jgi:hypothetical protein
VGASAAAASPTRSDPAARARRRVMGVGRARGEPAG